MKKILWEGFMWLNMKNDGKGGFERWMKKPVLWNSKVEAREWVLRGETQTKKVKVVVYAPEE